MTREIDWLWLLDPSTALPDLETWLAAAAAGQPVISMLDILEELATARGADWGQIDQMRLHVRCRLGEANR
jgi:hypothetical protein